MNKVRAKKYLGQHFLKDKNIAERIVDSLSATEAENVLEIGPGMGILTQFLREREKLNTFLIEIDQESVNYLKNEFPDLRDKIILADFLKIKISDYFKSKVCIIGNLPYNISSQIFFKVLEHRDLVPEVVCMIQKEVAQRICEKEGTKVYGILSVLLQTYYNIEYLFTVNENVFDPPPKVKSAVIRLTRNDRERMECDEQLFFKVVKTGFNQRRKMLRNSLKSILLNLEFESEMLTMRPEQLSVSQFIELTQQIEKQIQIKT